MSRPRPDDLLVVHHPCCRNVIGQADSAEHVPASLFMANYENLDLISVKRDKQKKKMKSDIRNWWFAYVLSPVPQNLHPQ